MRALIPSARPLDPCSRWLLAGSTALVLLAAVSPARAGLMDAIKKKATDSAAQKAASQVDKAATPASAPASAADGGSGDASATAAPSGAAPAGSGGSVSSVSTKFDFVPGDSVLMMDDFTQDELGEFPARWRLTEGTFEVAESSGEHWLRCTSIAGHMRMKLPAGLPEFWTLEFDFYGVNLGGAIALEVSGLSASASTVWQLRFPYSGQNLEFSSGAVRADTPFEGNVEGRHHVMLMARGTSLKTYLDRQRMASIPEITGGPATEIDFKLGAPSQPMITNVRFAEGCRPPKDLLAEGKLVTYGIRFDTGSDVVQPESAPVLRQVADYMAHNPTVKLRITGHTDDVGAAASNLDLSKRRAAAVAKVLATQLGVAAERLTTDGKGDTKAIASNAKPEGRAMNRRVEFTRL